MAGKRKKKKRSPALILGLIVCLCLLGLVFKLRLDMTQPQEPSSEAAPAVETETPMPAPTPTPAPTPMPSLYSEEERARWAQDAPALRLSELMVKNTATLRDEDGDFSDWIELENTSDRAIDLEGWRLSDKESGSKGWVFPAMTLGAGERLLIFASGKDRSEAALHTDFSLSEGEWLSLRTPDGIVAFSLQIPELDKDCSLIWDGDGYKPCVWPTPGESNDAAGYEAWQQKQERTSPLLISEVMTANPYGIRGVEAGLDWVELTNVSDTVIELSDYYLSDDRDDYLLWQLPAGTLRPGQCILLACDEEGTRELPCATFSLSAERESLYLSTQTQLCDFVSLHDLPFLGSCGRVEGQNGFFYFSDPTPDYANGRGVRRVSATPAVSLAGGLFEGVDELTLELSAPGMVYYTLDGSYPGTGSTRCTGPITLTETAVLRAVAVEEGALPSRPLTESYFLNEGHTLPVASLVADSYPQFLTIYQYKATESEIPGWLSLYEADGSFGIGCGITMSGATTLDLPKKNVSVHFRGAYGASELDYDLFGGGVTSFSSLTFRGGQDYYTAIIRNELLQNLALQMDPDHMVTQRSRYCVLYVNGNYYGIYALKEKINRSFYATWAGVGKESVTLLRSPVSDYLSFGRDVYRYVMDNDMADPAHYAHFCEIADEDSFIDWLIMEGYCTNTDIASGNLRYARSTEGDGRWRTVFYDLDTGLRRNFSLYDNVIGDDDDVRSQQASQILLRLLRNGQFRARFLERLSAALYGPLSDANVLAEIDRLYAEIESELPRDFTRWWRVMDEFEEDAANLRRLVTGRAQQAYDDICRLLKLSEEEKRQYFPDPLS